METLGSDPVSWSRSAVGSSFRFLVMACLHVLIWIIVVVFEGEDVVILVLPITVFPILYLYAMKRLLQELDQERQK